MQKYRTRSIAETMPLLGAAILASAGMSTSATPPRTTTFDQVYSVDVETSTISAFADLGQNYPTILYDPLGAAVSSLYSRLLSELEPLGGEFEKVLFENLWDLYEDD